MQGQPFAAMPAVITSVNFKTDHEGGGQRFNRLMVVVGALPSAIWFGVESSKHLRKDTGANCVLVTRLVIESRGPGLVIDAGTFATGPKISELDVVQSTWYS